MYEKIRFLQDYREGRLSKVTRRFRFDGTLLRGGDADRPGWPTDPWVARRQAPTVIDMHNDVTGRYKSAYEERMNPFSEFHEKVGGRPLSSRTRAARADTRGDAADVPAFRHPVGTAAPVPEPECGGARHAERQPVFPVQQACADVCVLLHGAPAHACSVCDVRPGGAGSVCARPRRCGRGGRQCCRRLGAIGRRGSGSSGARPSVNSALPVPLPLPGGAAAPFARRGGLLCENGILGGRKRGPASSCTERGAA